MKIEQQQLLRDQVVKSLTEISKAIFDLEDAFPKDEAIREEYSDLMWQIQKIRNKKIILMNDLLAKINIEE